MANTSYEITIPEAARVVSREGTRAVFEISGLYPGYGVTLGNALRRVLLSSLPGAAVTEVAFAGVEHEFATIPGIRETVLDILLNAKQIRLKMFSDEPQLLTLKKKGEGVATTDDLVVPAQVSVVSKALPIATLTEKKAEFETELLVERGIGYSPANLRKKEKMPIGRIAIDAIFAPVREANFTVENMRVGDRTDFHRLQISIETDGTISPDEAFAHANQILVKQFSAIIPEDFREHEAHPEKASLLKEPLATLGLTGRIVTALEESGVRTVSGLVRKKEQDVVAIEGIGEKAKEEIVETLAKHGLSLK